MTEEQMKRSAGMSASEKKVKKGDAKFDDAQ
jgi:hypothetical protein